MRDLVVTVPCWTGRETRLLREAMRLSVRGFAVRLGVSDRSVSKWESGGAAMVPRPETQAILDTALQQVGEDVRRRFAARLHLLPPAARPAGGPGFAVSSHKFIPVYIGPEAARRLLADPRFTHRTDRWLSGGSTELHHPAAASCRLTVFECGVAVYHLRQPREADRIADLAAWRYRSYEDDLRWASKLTAALAPPGSATSSGVPEYVLSAYVLERHAWQGPRVDAALRLLCSPSVLVERGGPDGVRPLGAEVEESLLSTPFDPPGALPFGVREVSVGYAGWSGISYWAQSPERALSAEELVECELTVQALWCYCRHIETIVEDGRDPAMPEQYGWRFLRAAHSRLARARAQETAQHVLMREAILRTSGLLDRLKAAQDVLRDSGA